jgi:hypothetical protein
MSKLKNKLSFQVEDIAEKNLFNGKCELRDMTSEMEDIYLWALRNAPIRQLRKWKKEFIHDQKKWEEQ